MEVSSKSTIESITIVLSQNEAEKLFAILAEVADASMFSFDLYHKLGKIVGDQPKYQLVNNDLRKI